MPIYERKCDKCNFEFEAFVSLREKEKIKCPECKGKTSQVFSTFMDVWKTDGSYKGDTK